MRYYLVIAIFLTTKIPQTYGLSTTVNPQDCVPAASCRTGKRGPIGPPGLPGPQGNCTCNDEDKPDTTEEFRFLQEHVARIRHTLPETFCLLGMKDGTIPDTAISVSSRDSHKQRARLDDPRDGWYPSSNHVSRTGREWIMVDLGEIKNVSGVVTQGQYNANQWTKTFKVEHSIDGNKFIDVVKGDGSELVRIFNGNADRSTKVINRFPKPVRTRFVRIYPLTFQGWPFIRFDVIDC